MARPVENPVTGGPGRIPVSECPARSSSPGACPPLVMTSEEEHVQELTLGVDVACRAAHQASLADEAGRFAWTGRRFRTMTADLQQLWDSIPPEVRVTVVMEPTRNAWVPLAAWFRRRGATIVMVPPE